LFTFCLKCEDIYNACEKPEKEKEEQGKSEEER
jgi:hypothetical protein